MGKLLYYGFAKEIQSLAVKNTSKRIIKNLQNQLRTVASTHGLASVSSVQLGETNQMFVMLQSQYLKKDKWNEYKRARQANYDCFCNPQICDVSEESSLKWEQCGSYPGLKMLINRPISIIWKYMTEGFKDIGPQEVTGFQARIIQHEMDHMIGLDFIHRAQQIQITNPSLHQQHDPLLQKLFNQFKKDRTPKSPQFKKLKQMIIYSIIDKQKK